MKFKPLEFIKSLFAEPEKKTLLESFMICNKDLFLPIEHIALIQIEKDKSKYSATLKSLSTEIRFVMMNGEYGLKRQFEIGINFSSSFSSKEHEKISTFDMSYHRTIEEFNTWLNYYVETYSATCEMDDSHKRIVHLSKDLFHATFRINNVLYHMDNVQ